MVDEPQTENSDSEGFDHVHVHEAAHALMAWMHGLKIDKVTITGPTIEENGYGTPFYCTIHGRAMCAYDRVDDNDIIQRVQICLAPVVEQERRYGVIKSLHDAEEALNFCSIGGCKNGSRHIVERAMEIQDEPDPPLAFYHEHKEQVSKVLSDPRAQKALDALADHLKAEGSLSGVDAVRVLQAAYGDPLPEKAIPAEQHGTTLRDAQSVESARRAALQLCKTARDLLMSAKPDNDEQETERENLLCDLLQFQFKWGDA